MSIIENYKTIHLANGLVNIPEDWIVVSNPFGLDSEATDLAVVESRNWEKYKVPHFAILVNSVKLTVENCDKIIAACCEVYPALTDIIAMQVDPPMTSPKTDPEYWAKAAASQASPYLGVFRVAATDDDFYDPDHHYPLGYLKPMVKTNPFETLKQHCKQILRYFWTPVLDGSLQKTLSASVLKYLMKVFL